MISSCWSTNVPAHGRRSAGATSRRGNASRAGSCCGRTRPTARRSPDCPPSCGRTWGSTRSASRGAPTIAAAHPGSCFARLLASRRIALPAPVPAPDVVPLNTVYGIVTRERADAVALAALLNSCWLTALGRLVGDQARRGFRRFNARVVGSLPMPHASGSTWAELAARGSRCEPADDLVADALELDAADRRALAADSL